MTELDTDRRARDYLAAYDTQLRARVLPRDASDVVETDGPVIRKSSMEGRGFITYVDLDGLDGDALDALIVRQRDHYAERNQAVEWKYHGYDRPADLPQRLRAAGFEPDEAETIVIGTAADHVLAQRLPDGVELREVTRAADLERIRVMQERVWNAPFDWLPGALAAELASTTEPARVFVVEADGEVVSAAWIRFHTGTEFTSLWGGSTLPQWRGRGIYKALVARRAQLALAEGFEYLQFDCTDDSRPILRRMGMSWVATTVPYVWTPPTAT